MSKTSDPRTRVQRGKVTKTFKDILCLSGFMDDQHFRTFAQNHIATLTREELDDLLAKVQLTRDHVATLAAEQLDEVEVRPVDPTFVDQIASDSTFQRAYGGINYRFMWVRPERLLALQAFQWTNHESVPKDEQALLEYALSNDWTLPAEISFTPPTGPIYVSSSKPQAYQLEVELDSVNSQVIIKPQPHINLVQVVSLNGRYFLKNGYHRVGAAAVEGIEQIPALVFDARSPADVDMGHMGVMSFNWQYCLGSARPPLVSDFGSPATVAIPMREMRYGASVTLQISPFNIGV